MEISLDVPSFPDVDREFQNAVDKGATPGIVLYLNHKNEENE